MNKLDKIIDIARQIREEAAMGAAPTNSASTAGLGYNPETEGPPIRKKKKYIYGGKNSRKWWLQFLRR
jgi:hypothetical protein